MLAKINTNSQKIISKTKDKIQFKIKIRHITPAWQPIIQFFFSSWAAILFKILKNWNMHRICVLYRNVSWKCLGIQDTSANNIIKCPVAARAKSRGTVLKVSTWKDPRRSNKGGNISAAEFLRWNASTVKGRRGWLKCWSRAHAIATGKQWATLRVDWGSFSWTMACHREGLPMLRCNRLCVCNQLYGQVCVGTKRGLIIREFIGRAAPLTIIISRVISFCLFSFAVHTTQKLTFKIIKIPRFESLSIN